MNNYYLPLAVGDIVHCDGWTGEWKIYEIVSGGGEIRLRSLTEENNYVSGKDIGWLIEAQRASVEIATLAWKLKQLTDKKDNENGKLESGD